MGPPLSRTLVTSLLLLVASVATVVPAVASVDILDRPATATDAYLPQQWGLEAIRAPEVWETTRGEGIVVAVVDSGVSVGHPDLADAIARTAEGDVLGYDLIGEDGDPIDEHGHGTMIAGIVGARADAGLGVVGVAPLATIMPLRVLDTEAAGRSRDVDAAIRWAVDNGADIVNLSLELGRDGAGIRDEDAVPVDAVRYAWERDVIVVAAAGNEGSDITDFPDEAPVIVVGAVGRDGEPAAFSDRGRADALLAPGVDIVSTWCRPCGRDATHTVGVSDGTSYAAAHVSGALALLLAAELTPAEAVRHLRATARTSGSRIDVAAALEAAGAADVRGHDGTPLVAGSRSELVRGGAIALAALLLLVNVAALVRWRRRRAA